MTVHYYVILTGLDSGGNTVTTYAATIDHTTYASEAPASTYLQGRLKQVGSISHDMYGGGRLRGTGLLPRSVGAIVLRNDDGDLDALRNNSYDGQYYHLHEFDPDVEGSHVHIRSGVVEQPLFTLTEVVFAVRDASHALDVPLLVTKYAGTNSGSPLTGVEGTANDIKGQPKPILVGTRKNITPICVNTAKLIYQLDGVRGFAAGFTLDPKDLLVSIPRDGAGAYASQADMLATAPVVGTYREYPAGGMFRLGSTPQVLTVDAMNPANIGGVGTDELQHVLERLLITRSVLSPNTREYLFDDNDVSVGYYSHDEVTVGQAVAEVLGSVQGFITAGYSPTGAYVKVAFWLSHLEVASNFPYTNVHGNLVLSEDDDSILEIEQVAPKDDERGLPVWRVNLNYLKNDSPMSKKDLEDMGASVADQEFYSREYRTITVEDSAVKTQWPYATELNVTTLLYDTTEATAEANRLLTLFKTKRRVFRVKCPAEKLRESARAGTTTYTGFQIMSRVDVTHSRFGMSGGVTMVAVGLQEDFESDTITFIGFV